MRPVNDERRAVDGTEIVAEVERPEAFPYRLLHPPRDTKRCERAGTCGIGEVAGHTQLERALTIRHRVLLPQPGGGEFLAHGQHRRTAPTRRHAREIGAGDTSTNRAGA